MKNLIVYGLLLLALLQISYGGESQPAPLSIGNSDPFIINLGKQKTVTVDFKKVFPQVKRDDVQNIGDLFVGILHQNLRCVEVITEDPIQYLRSDGLYNRVPAQYAITQEQFRTLLDDNPLVILKYEKPKLNKDNDKEFKRFSICGDELPSFAGAGEYESVQVLARENLHKTDASLRESPDPRCSSEYIPFSNVPGRDIPYFQNVQTNPRLKRFGLSALSTINDVPEGVPFIPRHPQRPLFGFGSHPSLKKLLLEEPQCNIELLRKNLQTAIELEWATIPLYLTAYYSIKSENIDIRSAMHKIFIQEMLHFAQAANLLIAVGELPVIDSSVAPTYPRIGLPGGILEGLYIPLTKLTIDQTYHTFMGVEIPNNSSAVDPPEINDLYTIGAFYKDIMSCIEHLGDSAFANPSGPQVEYQFYSHGTLYTVNDVASARMAIDQIVGQGEGETPLNPGQIGSDGYAHFYSFEEIVCGKKLVEKDGAYYAYQGASIPFDENAIYNMIDNPNNKTILPGSNCYRATQNCNDAYVEMIETLKHAFQTGSGRLIQKAVYQMNTLKSKAIDVFKEPYDDDSIYTCGPVWDMDF